MGNDNVIEFNGKRYDALTGKVIGSSHTEVVEPLAPAITPKRHIDGVSRRHNPKTITTHSVAAATPAKPRSTTALHRRAGSAAKARQPQAPKTLMRRAVHKPKNSMKPAIKPQAPAEVMAKPISAVALKHSVHQVDPRREHRAHKTPRNSAVHRFASHAERPTLEPVAIPRTQPVSKPITKSKPYTNTKPDIFESAIAHARSHEQPHHDPRPKHRRHRKTVGFMAGVISLLVIGGIFGYMNLSSIRVKVASVQAGFEAQMPAYQPTGYVLGAVTTSSGNVSLNFQSGEKQYRLTQQPTDWNSQTLSDHIIASAGAKTTESNGRIIYIYDDIATWISGGVRYDLTGNAELRPDEVAAIAASL